MRNSSQPRQNLSADRGHLGDAQQLSLHGGTLGETWRSDAPSHTTPLPASRGFSTPNVAAASDPIVAGSSNWRRSSNSVESLAVPLPCRRTLPAPPGQRSNRLAHCWASPKEVGLAIALAAIHGERRIARGRTVAGRRGNCSNRLVACTSKGDDVPLVVGCRWRPGW